MARMSSFYWVKRKAANKGQKCTLELLQCCSLQEAAACAQRERQTDKQTDKQTDRKSSFFSKNFQISTGKSGK